MRDVAAHGIQIAEGVQAGNEIGRRADAVQSDFAHARHDAHIGDDVGTVGDFHACFADWGIHRAHDIGHDVHGAAAHGAIEERTDFVPGGAGIYPVVGGTGILFFRGADEGEVLGAGDVIGTAAMQVTVRV